MTPIYMGGIHKNDRVPSPESAPSEKSEDSYQHICVLLVKSSVGGIPLGNQIFE